MTVRRRRLLLKAALAAGGAPLCRWAPASRAAEFRPSEDSALAGEGLLVAKRRALVMGNSQYGFSPLKNPDNDARAIAAILRGIGFQVTLALDSTRVQMLDAIGAYSRALAADKAVGVFYFAGHGVQLAWRNYLLPLDARVHRMEEIQGSCVDLNSLIEGIAEARNAMNVIILDACRQNPFGRDFRVEQKGLSQIDAPSRTLLAYATAPGGVAIDGAGDNGLYTENLLREIRAPEAKIEDVFKRVRLSVRLSSHGLQIPWESTSLEQDFYFIPPKELARRAQEDIERELKEQQALWEKVQAEERERKAQAERERLRREELARAEQARLAEARRLEEAERRHRQLEAAERDRQAREEAARKEAASKAREEPAPLPVEDYLRRYPSGFFAEIAQAQLDATLEREGEKRIEVVNSPQNPYSQGFLRADTHYSVGDAYTYNILPLDGGSVKQTYTDRAIQITETEIIYGNGLITDVLGNLRKLPGGRRFGDNQVLPSEYSVGKRWTSSFHIIEQNRNTRLNSLDMRITGKERVTVPAGTFDCFVVRIQGTSFGATPMGLSETVIEQTIWMAPDKCRRFIALDDSRRSRDGRRVVSALRRELVSFRQA